MQKNVDVTTGKTAPVNHNTYSVAWANDHIDVARYLNDHFDINIYNDGQIECAWETIFPKFHLL